MQNNLKNMNKDGNDPDAFTDFVETGGGRLLEPEPELDQVVLKQAGQTLRKRRQTAMPINNRVLGFLPFRNLHWLAAAAAALIIIAATAVWINSGRVPATEMQTVQRDIHTDAMQALENEMELLLLTLDNEIDHEGDALSGGAVENLDQLDEKLDLLELEMFMELYDNAM